MPTMAYNRGCPPNVATAASVLTRVLVLLLLKVIATVLPANAPNNDAGTDPDLTALLWLSALRTRLVSSAGLRS